MLGVKTIFVFWPSVKGHFVLNLCVTACVCVLICVSKGKREMEKEGEVREMIDAGVRVHAGVDIYGPCSGLACCSLGGLPQARTKPQGPIGSPFWL